MTTTIGLPAIDQPSADRGDLQLWSVTTIIGTMDKPALLYWAAEQTALAAIHSEATWRGMLADDNPTCEHKDATCPAVKWLRDARTRPPRDTLSATGLGTVVHSLAEGYALTGVRPDMEAIEARIRQENPRADLDKETPVVTAMLNQFDDWLGQFQPSYQATEVAVYNPQLGYAGTADAFLTIDGVRFIVDYKTSRKSLDNRGRPTTPYPEQVGLQLAAYRHATHAAVWRPRRLEKLRRRYYLLSQDEQQLAQAVPEVDTGLVIHITPEHCDAYPIVCDDNVFEAFLAVQDAARWVLQDSRLVMSDPLTPSAGV